MGFLPPWLHLVCVKLATNFTRVTVPNVTVGIFIGMSLIWGWLSDGPLHGRRWPFIYIGAVITVRTTLTIPGVLKFYMSVN